MGDHARTGGLSQVAPVTPRTLIVSATDGGFLPLLQDLVASLVALSPRPFTDIACFDLGLTPAERDSVGAAVRHWAIPDWDLPVAEATRAAHPEYRALTGRPFLPRYFPGYDVYLWIDADAWVQRAFAFAWHFAAAAHGALAAAPHADRSYCQTPDLLRWRYGRAMAYGGRALARHLQLALPSCPASVRPGRRTLLRTPPATSDHRHPALVRRVQNVRASA